MYQSVRQAMRSHLNNHLRLEFDEERESKVVIIGNGPSKEKGAKNKRNLGGDDDGRKEGER